MEILQILEAKARLSAVVTVAEQGRPTVITRHGHPCAMVVPIEMGQHLYPLEIPNFAAYLLTIPEALETERNPTALPNVDSCGATG